MTVRFSSRFAILALALTAAASVQAQSGLKVAILDPDLIVVRLPEYRMVQAQVQQLEGQIGAQLQAKQDSAITFQNDLRAMTDSPVVDAQARAATRQTLERLLGELEVGESQGLRLLADAEFQMLQPLLARISQAVEEVVEEESIDLVFAPRANNAPVLLYAGESIIDLTVPVLEKLGFQIDAEGNVTPPESTPGLELAQPAQGATPPAGGN